MSFKESFLLSKMTPEVWALKHKLKLSKKTPSTDKFIEITIDGCYMIVSGDNHLLALKILGDFKIITERKCLYLSNAMSGRE